jgi:hypothetical protein
MQSIQQSLASRPPPHPPLVSPSTAPSPRAVLPLPVFNPHLMPTSFDSTLRLLSAQLDVKKKDKKDKKKDKKSSSKRKKDKKDKKLVDKGEKKSKKKKDKRPDKKNRAPSSDSGASSSSGSDSD